MRDVAYSKEATRALLRMPTNEAARIRAKIAQYARDPASLSPQVKRLKGRPLVRLRVGDWRVIMDERGVVIVIVAVGPRGGIYEA